MEIISGILLLLFGLIIGSFLNVCIYRIPEEESINYPPSHCQHCKHRLGVLDLVPVMSYVCLGGKCRYCGERISCQYPIIELLNGVGYVGAYMHFGLSLELLLACGFISIVIVLTMIDWQHMILPTKVIMVGCVWAVVIQAIRSYVQADWGILIGSILAGMLGYGVVAAVFWLSLWLAKKEGMGYGDVRYLGMIGLFTSPSLVFLTMLLGSVIGAIYGVALYIKNKESAYFPFGPFLSIGALISFFYGHTIIQAYMTWCMGLMG